MFDEPQLAALCLECIDKNTPEALTADGFTDIDIDTLSAVLDRDSLRIKENKLFAAVLRWSESECQRQSLPVTVENKRSACSLANTSTTGCLVNRNLANKLIHRFKALMSLIG